MVLCMRIWIARWLEFDGRATFQFRASPLTRAAFKYEGDL
jgi:hypothetical protein